MASSLTADEKFELITRRLKEVLGGDIIKKVLEERDAKGYWGLCSSHYSMRYVSIDIGVIRNGYDWEA